MLKRSNNDYYSKMWELTKQIFDEYELIKYVKYNDENEKELLKNIYLEKLYNILLDILNQVIYDKINDFSSNDVDFIVSFEIDKIFPDIIRLIHEKIDIKNFKKKMLNKNNKENKNNLLKNSIFDKLINFIKNKQDK